MKNLKVLNPFQFTTISLNSWTVRFVLMNPIDSFSWFWDELENDW